jgi:hypothetical protein
MRTGIAALIGAVLAAVVMAEVSTSTPATTEAEAVTRLERRVAALERRVAALERVARLQITINRVTADQMKDALDQQILVTSYLTGIASVPPRTGAQVGGRSCPSGQQLIGGGFRSNYPLELAQADLVTNFGWQVAVFNPYGMTATVSGKMFCASIR